MNENAQKNMDALQAEHGSVADAYEQRVKTELPEKYAEAKERWDRAHSQHASGSYRADYWGGILREAGLEPWGHGRIRKGQASPSDPWYVKMLTGGDPAREAALRQKEPWHWPMPGDPEYQMAQARASAPKQETLKPIASEPKPCSLFSDVPPSHAEAPSGNPKDEAINQILKAADSNISQRDLLGLNPKKKPSTKTGGFDFDRKLFSALPPPVVPWIVMLMRERTAEDNQQGL